MNGAGLLPLVEQRVIALNDHFVECRQAGDLQAASSSQQVEGLIWLIPTQRTPNTQNEAARASYSGQHSIQVTRQFALAFWSRDAGTQFGGDALDITDDRITQLELSLIGWRPSDDFEPCHYVGGRVLKFGAGAIFWVDEFRTEHRLTASI